MLPSWPRARSPARATPASSPGALFDVTGNLGGAKLSHQEKMTLFAIGIEFRDWFVPFGSQKFTHEEINIVSDVIIKHMKTTDVYK
jgi:hypothetical protein